MNCHVVIEHGSPVDGSGRQRFLADVGMTAFLVNGEVLLFDGGDTGVPPDR